MSKRMPSDGRRAPIDGIDTATEDTETAASLGALPFLLQFDPDAIIEVVLVDQPVALPVSQFEALLVDSECEV